MLSDEKHENIASAIAILRERVVRRSHAAAERLRSPNGEPLNASRGEVECSVRRTRTRTQPATLTREEEQREKKQTLRPILRSPLLRLEQKDPERKIRGKRTLSPLFSSTSSRIIKILFFFISTCCCDLRHLRRAPKKRGCGKNGRAQPAFLTALFSPLLNTTLDSTAFKNKRSSL